MIWVETKKRLKRGHEESGFPLWARTPMRKVEAEARVERVRWQRKMNEKAGRCSRACGWLSQRVAFCLIQDSLILLVGEATPMSKRYKRAAEEPAMDRKCQGISWISPAPSSRSLTVWNSRTWIIYPLLLPSRSNSREIPYRCATSRILKEKILCLRSRPVMWCWVRR